MDSIWLKAKELLTYHCHCHCNLVTIAMKYVTDAYCSEYKVKQRSYKVKQSSYKVDA